MKFECGKCDNIFEVSGIKESIVTCSKCGSRNSIVESNEGSIREEYTADKKAVRKAIDQLEIISNTYNNLTGVYKTMRDNKIDDDTQEYIHSIMLKIEKCYDAVDTFVDQTDKKYVSKDKQNTRALQNIWTEIVDVGSLSRETLAVAYSTYAGAESTRGLASVLEDMVDLLKPVIDIKGKIAAILKKYPNNA